MHDMRIFTFLFLQKEPSNRGFVVINNLRFKNRITCERKQLRVKDLEVAENTERKGKT